MTKKSEIRDNMQIEWDIAIAMDDGIVLRADVFRPIGQGTHPVILSYGPYAKGLSFQEGYKGNWARLIEQRRKFSSARPTSIRTGNWSILRDGCRTAMPACASTRVVLDAHPACSMCGPRGKPWTCTNAWNGPARSPGAAARLGSTAFPTMR